MSQDNPQAELLRTLLNSGRFRLPLCHSHALEIVALLHGAKDWNTVAAGPAAAEAKARAKALRATLGESAASEISIEAAAHALAVPLPPASIKPATNLDQPKPSAVPVDPIRFVREDWGKAEWRADNPNRLMGEALDNLLERGRADPRFMERKGKPLLREYPGDLELINSVAVAKFHLEKYSEAGALWQQGWHLISDPLAALLQKSPRAKLSYSVLENRPLYRVLHGHATSLWAIHSTAAVDEAIRLSGIAFQLSRDRDGIGFRMLHVCYLAAAERWPELIEFVDKMDRGNRGRFEIFVLRAAAAVMLGQEDADRRFAQSLEMNPWAFEILANGVAVRGRENAEGMTLGSWEEGAALINDHPSVWAHSPVRASLRRLRPQLLKTQIDEVRCLQRAQAHFDDPPRTREYLASYRTPAYAGLTPILEAAWQSLWPDLQP